MKKWKKKKKWDCNFLILLRARRMVRWSYWVWRHHKRFVQRAWSLLEEISPEILQLDLGAHVLGNLYFHFRGFMIHIKVGGRWLNKQTILYLELFVWRSYLDEQLFIWSNFFFLSFYLQCDLRQTLLKLRPSWVGMLG